MLPVAWERESGRPQRVGVESGFVQSTSSEQEAPAFLLAQHLVKPEGKPCGAGLGVQRWEGACDRDPAGDQPRVSEGKRSVGAPAAVSAGTANLSSHSEKRCGFLKIVKDNIIYGSLMPTSWK